MEAQENQESEPPAKKPKGKAGRPKKPVEKELEFEAEPIDVENIPKCLEMVKFGVAAMWREMRRLTSKSETKLLDIQEQKLYGNYVEFFLKLHASGVLEKVLEKDGDGPSAQDMREYTPHALAELTIQAARNLGLNAQDLHFNNETGEPENEPEPDETDTN